MTSVIIEIKTSINIILTLFLINFQFKYEYCDLQFQ